MNVSLISSVITFFRKYSLGGSYRKILGIPTNFSWKIVHYNEKHDDLILSDIDEMRKRASLMDKLGKSSIFVFISFVFNNSFYIYNFQMDSTRR